MTSLHPEHNVENELDLESLSSTLDNVRRPAARTRATSISAYVEPLPRTGRAPPPQGLRLTNGILHPHDMPEPGEDGYRTPTGEDIEHTRRLGSLGEVLRQRGSKLSRADSNHKEVHGISELEASPSKSSNSNSDNSSDKRATERTLDHIRDAAHSLEERLVLNWRQRLEHFTWTFFTITMATGGLANVIYHVPFRFTGLYALGCIFFLLNIVLFITNVACMCLRFHFHPHTFWNSILHPTESLFIPAATVSFGTILLNVSQYAYGHVGDWLNTVVLVLFWVDVALAIVASFGIYLLMWSTQTFTIATMTPVWIFPAYPLLIIGPHAGVLSSILDPSRSARILVGGFTAQGIGMLVSMMVYSAYIYRLMTQKLPRDSLRPGMFVSVGPSAFTAGALINMSADASRIYGDTDFMGDGKLASMIMLVVANWAALWFWGLACWFFLVSVGAHWHVIFRGARMPFAMTWFSYVFPQTALVNATFGVAKAFDIYPLQILGCVMAVALAGMWVFVVVMMVRAIWQKQILWPQKGEDKDEGGFKSSQKQEADTMGRTTGVEKGRIGSLPLHV